MGFHVEWLAFRDTTADDACAALGATRTGEYGEIFPNDLVGAELPDGSYLVVADGGGPDGGLSETFPSTSTLDTEILSFSCYDNPMVSMLTSWTKGQENWRISYMSDESPPLHLEGPVPEAARDIRARLELSQQEADANGEAVDYMYELTGDLGQELTGFRHDVVDDRLRFEILSRSAPPRAQGKRRAQGQRKPWWKLW